MMTDNNQGFCHSVYEFILNLDIFGYNFIPQMMGRKKYRSIIGAIITLLLFALVLADVIKTIIDISKNKLCVVTEEQDEEINYNHLMDFNLTFYVPMDEGMDVYDSFEAGCGEIDKDDCSNIVFYSQEISDGFSTYIFDFSKNRISNDPESNEYYGFVYYKKKDDNESDPYFDVKLSRGYVNLNDHDHPVHYRAKEIFVEDVARIKDNFIIFLTTVQIKYVKDYSFGFFSFKKETAKNYTIFNGEFERATAGQYLDDYNTFVFTLKHDQFIKTYIFTDFCLSDIISDLGGSISIALFIANFLSSFINGILYDRKVEQIIICPFYQINQNNVFTENQSSINILKNNNQNKNYLNGTSPIITANETGTNVINQSEAGKLDNINSIQNMSSLIGNNPTQISNQANIKQNAGIIISKIENKEDAIKNKDILVEQFNCELDFWNIYSMMNEIKVLEMMTLDNNRLKLLHEVMKSEINGGNIVTLRRKVLENNISSILVDTELRKYIDHPI